MTLRGVLVGTKTAFTGTFRKDFNLLKIKTVKITDAITKLEGKISDYKNLPRNRYTSYTLKRHLGTLQRLTEALKDGFTYTNENYDGFWGEASQEDIAEKLETNILVFISVSFFSHSDSCSCNSSVCFSL